MTTSATHHTAAKTPFRSNLVSNSQGVSTFPTEAAQRRDMVPPDWVLRPGRFSENARVQPNVPVATGGTQLDVQGSDAQLLAPLGNILGCQHRCVGRRLVSVSLHLHATSHTADGFPTKQENIQKTTYSVFPANKPAPWYTQNLLFQMLWDQ